MQHASQCDRRRAARDQLERRDQTRGGQVESMRCDIRSPDVPSGALLSVPRYENPFLDSAHAQEFGNVDRED